MKSLFALASVLAFAAAPALAADGQVSDQALAKMGLGSMKSVSDAQGMHIRGLSIAVVGGYSSAYTNTRNSGASTTNFYFAAGNHSATGATASAAGQLTASNYHISGTLVGAGGFATASAH